MTTANTVYPHTAITTWNGFIYQGKIAIYHVLQLLSEPGMQNNWKLQLDSLEDFAILDNTGSVQSLHQVKALKSQYYSSYSEAFEKLKNKANQIGCINAKFHVAREIFDKTVQDIASCHIPVQIYDYGPNCWCSVDDIDLKIEDKIKPLLATFHTGDHSKQTNDYVRKARGYLDQLVVKKVMNIHKIVHDSLMSEGEAAYSQTIPFSDFYDILSCDLNQLDLGDDYYFYMLLNDLHAYYQGYCIEYEDTLSQESLTKLSFCMYQIECLQQTDMIKFVRSIMPHRVFKIRSLREYKDNSFNKEEIQEAFLTILNTLKCPEFDTKLFFKWDEAGRTYTPTTIDKGQVHSTKICENIVKNALDTDIEIMFEGNCLITTSIDVESIVNHLPEIMRTLDSKDLELNRITKWNSISLISLNNVIGVIQ